MRCSAFLLPYALVLVLPCLSGCGSTWEWTNDRPVIREFFVNGAEVSPDGLVASAWADPEGNLIVAPSAALLAICWAVDPNDDDLTYDWRAASAIASTAGPGTSATSDRALASGTPASSSEQVFSGTAPSAEGIYVLSCAVSDGRGGVVSRTAHIRVANTGLNPPLAPGLVPATAEVAEGGTLDFVCRVSGAVSIDDLTFKFFAVRGTMTENKQTEADKNLAVYKAPLPAGGEPAGSAAGSDTVYCVVRSITGQYGVAVATVTVKAP